MRRGALSLLAVGILLIVLSSGEGVLLPSPSTASGPHFLAKISTGATGHFSPADALNGPGDGNNDCPPTVDSGDDDSPGETIGDRGNENESKTRADLYKLDRMIWWSLQMWFAQGPWLWI